MSKEQFKSPKKFSGPSHAGSIIGSNCFLGNVQNWYVIEKKDTSLCIVHGYK
jgi:hypothetical protein